ncbi:CRN-like protein [Plasmopara halstedii]|uniref:CRN-like protein n=1 Tax=Plasmopara halstedii TaxID=4781 RepID=A0A0P1AA83_PLAHL|nr:CRN-like protein [Plasmopara halstedii]CEG37265.1 CRN-like protein [Plasmopara halstedii]|eukprot:XP_024573634.1 CRN-like protein [Plasmopara halstedii]
MVTLFCAIIGVKGSAFSVEIDASQSVDHLKDAIAEKQKFDFAASKLELYLAKRGDAWLESGTEDVKKLKKGEKTALIEALMKEDQNLQAEDLLEENNMPTPESRQIHVLMVIPTEVAVAPPRKRVKLLLVEVRTPSSFARRRVWSNFFMHDGRIICDRVDRPENVRPFF